MVFYSISTLQYAFPFQLFARPSVGSSLLVGKVKNSKILKNSVGAYHASSAFHDQLVRSLFHSPMDFFDRTPLGRILNRLSNDIDRIDENIPWAVSFAMTVFAEALNSLISICVVIPWLMVVVLPLLAIFLFVVVRFMQIL